MAKNNRVGISERLSKEEKKRPLEALIRSKEEIEQEETVSNEEAAKVFKSYKTAVRKTFLLDPISIEALRIFAYKYRKGLSETIIDMLIKYIPREIWVEARNNIIDIEETPADYLDDVKLLDIDSVYYHPYKPSEEK